MKLIVLGCWGAYPKAGEATSGYLLLTDKHKILLDCGSGVLSNLFKHIGKGELDAVFLSHFHYDHCADLGCLLYASKFALYFQERNKPLPVYTHKNSSFFPELTFGEYTKGVEIKHGETIDLNGLKISFHHTVHNEYNLAMRFEYQGKILVYTGDLGPETDLGRFCSGADMLICETSLFEHEQGLFPGHMTTRDAAKLAKDSEVKKLLITHFPQAGDITRMPFEVKKYFKGTVFAAEMNRVYEV